MGSISPSTTPTSRRQGRRLGLDSSSTDRGGRRRARRDIGSLVSVDEVRLRFGKEAFDSIWGGQAMQELSAREAIERLGHAVEGMSVDDLIAVYDELFPEEPTPEEATDQVIPTLKRRIFDYIGRGLEVEEILDLWNVVFPEDRDVYYDEETEKIHFNEQPEPLRNVE